MQEILLATDLDGTLIGDNEALKSLNILLSELRVANCLKLAYVTGRSQESYYELVKQNTLLTPDVLITAVGAEIYWQGTALLSDWPKAPVLDNQAIINTLRNIPNLTLQPEIVQRPYRIGYYLKDDLETLELIKKKLNNFPVDIIYSHQEYLDILPKGINKGSSLKYLASYWKIDNSNIITCGDSGNDIDMLEINKAIVVANAKQELIDWVSNNQPKTDIYLAKQAYANGISEGLKYFLHLS